MQSENDTEITPHTALLGASYGVPFMTTLEIIYGESPAMCKDIRLHPFSCFCYCYCHTNVTDSECLSTGTTWWIYDKHLNAINAARCYKSCKSNINWTLKTYSKSLIADENLRLLSALCLIMTLGRLQAPCRPIWICGSIISFIEAKGRIYASEN